MTYEKTLNGLKVIATVNENGSVTERTYNRFGTVIHRYTTIPAITNAMQYIKLNGYEMEV